VFQLLQEYLALLVLSDVRIGFSNGGAPDVFALRGVTPDWRSTAMKQPQQAPSAGQRS
jgi:hypothetical protein